VATAVPFTRSYTSVLRRFVHSGTWQFHLTSCACQVNLTSCAYQVDLSPSSPASFKSLDKWQLIKSTCQVTLKGDPPEITRANCLKTNPKGPVGEGSGHFFGQEKNCMRLPFIPWSIAWVPSSQELPGFLITASPSVLVSAVLGALASWIQNQKQTKKKVKIDCFWIFAQHICGKRV